MAEIFIGIIVLIIILVISGNYKEKKRKEELRQKRILEEQKRLLEEQKREREEEQKRKREEEQKRRIALAEAERKRKEEEERKRLDELNNETIIVVYESINDVGKPIAIVKRSDNTYTSVERPETRFEISEKIRIEKEKINKWNWYDETEYQRQLLIKRQADLIRQQEVEKQKNQNQHLDKFRIDYLYHMTHRDNLQNILQNGLKSHNQARANNLTKVDIADNQVNDRRSRREPIYNRSIHDYVPLYFNPKNPMLFRRNNIQNDIVILAIDRKILYQENIVFTDGNAAANATSFYKNPEELNRLNWNCISAEYWNDIEDGKRIRCSEVLVYPNIQTNIIKKIFCNNEQTRIFITSKLNNFPNIEAEINSNLYFRGVVQQNSFNNNSRPLNNRISTDDLDDLPF